MKSVCTERSDAFDNGKLFRMKSVCTERSKFFGNIRISRAKACETCEQLAHNSFNERSVLFGNLKARYTSWDFPRVATRLRSSCGLRLLFENRTTKQTLTCSMHLKKVASCVNHRSWRKLRTTASLDVDVDAGHKAHRDRHDAWQRRLHVLASPRHYREL